MQRKATIVLLNALIWGFVLITSALALRGSDAFQQIELILGAGAVASLMLVSAGVLKTSQR